MPNYLGTWTLMNDVIANHVAASSINPLMYLRIICIMLNNMRYIQPKLSFARV